MTSGPNALWLGTSTLGAQARRETSRALAGSTCFFPTSNGANEKARGRWLVNFSFGPKL